MFGVALGTIAGTPFAAAFRCGARGLGFIVLIAGLTACATAERIEFNPTLGLAVREEVVAEMDIVAPLVTAAHLGNCKARLEADGFLGAKYKVVGELVPNVKASCFVQNRGTGPALIQSNAKAIAYVAAMTKIAGMYGTGSPNKVGGCRFTLVDGKVEFAGFVPERAHLANTCRNISSLDRAPGQPQLKRNQLPTGAAIHADA
jgi:hypothetical protein